MSIISPYKSYIFKVSFARGVWRYVQISSASSLYSLHELILKAFDFDDDHLYAFFMNGLLWSDHLVFWSPHYHDIPSADEVRLLSFNFKKGQKFLYLFDFGDEWVFEVTFSKEVDGLLLEPLIIETKGISPIQYPDYDDEYL